MKAAIIGLGAIAPVHAQAIRRAGGHIVAVCDIDKDQAARFRERAACDAPLFPDYRALLSSTDADVVHICTPHYLHAEMILAALQSGRHVLCEKPLCIREQDIPRILHAEKESGKKLGVCLQNRYAASNLAARALAGDSPRAAFGSVVWERGVAYYRSGPWRGRWETEGGGVMINQALHTLDLLLWIMGMPDTVIASTENRHLNGEIEVEDTASALFRFRDGRSFNFFATTAGGADMPVQITVCGNGHTITATPDTLTCDGNVQHTAAGKPIGKTVWGDGHADLVADFYDAIRSARPFAIDGAEAAKVVRAILAMYRSAGREVPLSEGG